MTQRGETCFDFFGNKNSMRQHGGLLCGI